MRDRLQYSAICTTSNHYLYIRYVVEQLLYFMTQYIYFFMYTLYIYTVIDIEDDEEDIMTSDLEKHPMIVNRQASNDENLFGVTVNSEEEAYNLYCEYGV